MPSSILNSDDGVISGTSGLKNSGGDDGTLAVQSNGTEVAKFKTTELVINDGGANYDFRVEGDTDANLLFVDASADRVGIGTSSPSRRLTTQFDSATTYSSSEFSSTSNSLYLRNANTTTNAFTGIEFLVGTNGEAAISSIRTGDGEAALAFGTRGGGTRTERARINSAGYFKASNNGSYDSATGSYHEFSTSNSDWAVRARNTAASNPYCYRANYSAVSPNNTGNQFLYCDDSTALRAEIRSNGGLANYSGNNSNLSDRREKTNFAPAKNYLETICAIPVQTFNYIDQNIEEDPGLTLGVVAQDVQEVAPELVTESNWGTQEEPKMRLSIYQTDLQYALMKCIQELKAELDEAKARIAALEAVPGNE